MKSQVVATWIAVGIGAGVAIGAATHALAISICIPRETGTEEVKCRAA